MVPIGAVAVVPAVAITGVLLAFTVGTGSEKALPSASTRALAPASPATQDLRSVPSIMSMTPAQLAGDDLGTGYALPSASSGPTMDQVLASMAPATRRYTEAITALTFAQLAAGAAGSP